MRKFVFNIDVNDIGDVTYCFDKNQILITDLNYMEINDSLLRSGNNDQMVLLINGYIHYYSTPIFRNMNTNKQIVLIYDWIIEHQYVLDGYAIKIPGLDQKLEQYCHYIDNNGVATYRIITFN